MNFFTPAEFVENYALIGEKKSNAPVWKLFLLGIFVNSAFLGYALLEGKLRLLAAATQAVAWSLGSYYLTLFSVGLLTLITEWRQISCRPIKKLLYLFTFPIFILTYIPISIVALFRNVEWTPIVHSFSVSLQDIRKEPIQ
ncbi:hypothetical protein SDC9_116558 [bioreactor metagenome]|uniref:Uncharacterized protein n=1 Tax=bioreactor metagenome TaxID=1076179 RepID=A0A645BVZ2_9ZZZZ